MRVLYGYVSALALEHPGALSLGWTQLTRARRDPAMTQASAVRARCPAALLTAIRGATARHADWDQTAALVAAQLRGHLPGPEILTAAEREGSQDGYVSYTLHVEPDGAFSVLAVVWRPGQQTPIHDHVTWCVVGVLQGAESEELFAQRDGGAALERVASRVNVAGEVGGFAPPGDVHRVTNRGMGVAISMHVYGADITRLGNSVRRVYDLPVRSGLPG
jgi:predicted metal-dependent enzyme (double-stranded beta helix superfamily)